MAVYAPRRRFVDRRMAILPAPPNDVGPIAFILEVWHGQPEDVEGRSPSQGIGHASGVARFPPAILLGAFVPYTATTLPWCGCYVADLLNTDSKPFLPRTVGQPDGIGHCGSAKPGHSRGVGAHLFCRH